MKNMEISLEQFRDITVISNKEGKKVELSELEKKCRQLISSARYQEADPLLQKIIFSKDKNMAFIQMFHICRKIINFEKNYNKNVQIFQEMPSDWLKAVLNEAVERTTEEPTLQKELEEKSSSILEYFYIEGINDFTPKDAELIAIHIFLKEKYKNKDDVFILGPSNIVNKFEGYESRVFYKTDFKSSYPFLQCDKSFWIFQKKQNYKLGYMTNNNICDLLHKPLIISKFPTINWQVSDKKMIFQPNNKCDVFASYNLIDQTTHKMIKYYLDKLANMTNDYFVPKYQNIIDPNMFTCEQSCDWDDNNKVRQWLATDILVEDYKSIGLDICTAIQLSLIKTKKKRFGKYVLQTIYRFLPKTNKGIAHISSPISYLNPFQNKELYVAIENIFTAALPLLSKLKRPALVLPGYLQAVVKAQRIYLQPGEEYSGVWHRDGKFENIVAVVIYYYRVSEGLQGGDLEFIDKRPVKDNFWLYGDCYPDNFTLQDCKNSLEEIPKCKIPVKEGLLVVFSNYQLIHRVLKMVHPKDIKGDLNAPGGFASRDFVLFFVVDQSKPLMSTKRIEEIKSDDDSRKRIRNEMFVDQMKPSGYFGAENELVYSTGNGCVSQLGWIDGKDKESYDEPDGLYYTGHRVGMKNLYLLNQTPPLNRGISWALDIEYYDNEEKKFSHQNIENEEDEENGENNNSD